uniref:Toll-like receptor 22 n=1 Tax=Sillago sinica TaxID=907714 RepID=A0A5J6SCN5_9TELE|nr:toll-like receptor 22 [Sillago sinica]
MGAKYLQPSTVFLLLSTSFVVPVAGFTLRGCQISQGNATCHNLTAVPGYIPSRVRALDLSSNKISKIHQSDFKNLSLVADLNLKRNRVSQIDAGAFAYLISLKILNLNRNRLEKLGDNVFDGLSNLTDLRFNTNRLKVVTSASFKSLTSLKFLDLSNNKLHTLQKLNLILQNLPNLETLSVENNDITTFKSWELTKSSLRLRSLDVSENPMAVFRITEDIFPNLTWLRIGNTHYKKNMIWDVRNKTFLGQVSTLDISEIQMAFEDIKTVLECVNTSLTSLRMTSMKHSLTALINVSCTIPTMSTLQLRSNRLTSIFSDVFQLCINVTELDLSKNYIKKVLDDAFRPIQGLRILGLNHNKLLSVPSAVRNLPALAELDLSFNNITRLESQDFANLTKLRHLSLYNNLISAIKDDVFKDLTQLQYLKLQTNHITHLGKVFKKHLPNLRQLHLNNNSLTTITRGQFQGLQSLQMLSLQDNKINNIENGSFIGLTNLMEIRLQSNNIDKKALESGGFNVLMNLRRLDLRDNHIKYEDTSPLPNPPFSHLSSLQTLAILGQHRRGKSYLPGNLLQGLTNLSELSLRNDQILYLPKNFLIHTPKLQMLDISSNDLGDLSPDFFSPVPNLTSLYISRASLRSLDFLIDANLRKLVYLQARRNTYSVISKEVIESLPSLTDLDLQYNTFTCDCDNLWFLQWVKNNNQTQVFDAYNFECNYPSDLKGTKLLDFDYQSCSVDIDFICFIATTCTTVIFMVVSLTYHFLRWQLAYAYYHFLALIFDSKHKNKDAHYQYDAFVSYNTHDEPWVIRELLPKLEGEQGWRLCLHHRDFEPGKPIIDNITDAIYRSRKTICVISHRYLESEWCSREIQVASFRLFDEKKDVLILVFLEEIPTSQMSPYYRMRKLLKKRTYLSWPQAGEYTGVFWEKLRQALRTGEDPGGDRFLLTVRDAP